MPPASPPPERARDERSIATRREQWAARLDRLTDHPLTLLALLLVPLLLAPFVLALSPPMAALLNEADTLIWALFAAALVAALLVSPDRCDYLRRHWLDLLLVVIPLVALARAARVLRLAWTVGAAARVIHGSRRLLARRGTAFLVLGVSFVVVVAAGLIVAVEHDDPQSTIQTYGDGLWWALTTIATVGYGDKYPVTAGGRGLAVALMLVGIAAFGVLTAELVTYLLGEREDTANRHFQEMDARLRRIEAALRPMQRRQVRKAAQARTRRRRRRQHTRATSRVP